ncbi:MAG: hypothetical protein H7Z74_14120 [Anaerolineae bacterium]|nr:hypothetical protein [Gemmatimonadaceae bacterium]
MRPSAQVTRRLATFTAVLAFAVSAARVVAQSPWRLQLRHHVNWGAPKTRAGDIQGYGIALSRDLANRWWVSGGVDRLEYDLETPIHATVVEPRPGDLPADAFTTVTRARVDAMYNLREGGRWRPAVGVGLGLYDINAAEVSGMRADGGAFALRIETPTTVGASATLQSEWRVLERVEAGFGVTYARTLSRYNVTETETGARGSITPFSPLGVTTQLSIRF